MGCDEALVTKFLIPKTRINCNLTKFYINEIVSKISPIIMPETHSTGAPQSPVPSQDRADMYAGVFQISVKPTEGNGVWLVAPTRQAVNILLARFFSEAKGAMVEVFAPERTPDTDRFRSRLATVLSPRQVAGRKKRGVFLREKELREAA